MKKWIKIIVVIVVSIIMLCISLYAYRGFIIYRFGCMKVTIQSDFEISSVSWHEFMSDIETVENPLEFIHPAGYGKYFYNVDLVYEDRIVPIEIGVFKSNNWMYYRNEFQFLKTDSDSEIVININLDGMRLESQTASIYDEEIRLSIGP